MHRRPRSIAALIAALGVLAGTLVAVAPVEAPSAAAADASQFNPAYIISDDKFYDGTSLNQADVQGFLNWISPGCQGGYTCLKDYRQDTWTRGGDSECAAYNGEAGEPAARIIVKVAQACGIGARVLLVTLQKEQGLVTSTAPTQAKYDRAMGYACPDTAPCDSQFFGFFNQVYKAAWQFKRYGNSSTFTYFPVGRQISMRYHPNAACGGLPITIANKATAALYYYTPYTPNVASLGNLYGTGDACSSYGNRNFWRFYTDWFGSPTQEYSPSGYIDGISTAPGGLRITGWASDPEAPASPLWVRVKVDGAVVTTIGSWLYRPDVTAVHPRVGQYMGFDRVIPAAAGARSVCVTALNIYNGVDRDLGCLSGTAGGGSVAPQPDLGVGAPRGWLDSITAAPGGAAVTGWALDPEIAGPIAIDVYADGAFVKRLTADSARADIGRLYPGYGAGHGFRGTVPLPPGTHSVCVQALGYGLGGNSSLGCGRVAAGSGAPFGWVDSATAVPGGIAVTGWTIDPDTADPIGVHAYVDGAYVSTLTANGTKADLDASFPGYGNQHGFSGTIPAGPGRHTVCLYGLGPAPLSVGTVGCAVVTVSAGVPFGWLDASMVGPGSVTVGGWAIDPDTTASVPVQVWVDGALAQTVTANLPRTDVAAVHPGYGPNHGYSATLAVAPGRHTVCSYGVDDRGVRNPTLGCVVLTVGTGSPIGWIDSIRRTPAGVVVGGWAIDPDSAAVVDVVATVDGTQVATGVANVARADVAAVHPGFGGSRGYSVTLPAQFTAGTVCVTARNIGPGADTRFNCVAIPAA